jgi:sialic acid synthase SpsE
MLKIKNIKLNSDEKAFIIAEIGINHNGDLKKAYKLIDAAVLAKCNAVKFQTFDVDTMVHESAEPANYQKKFTSKNQKKMLKEFQLSHKDFLKLKKYCDKKKIIFLSTPFDLNSANFLKDLVPAFKISSGDNDNLILLKHIKKFNKPVILSLGMMNKLEIKNIIKKIKFKKNKLVLLHCISEYPTKLSNTQLGVITELKKTGYLVGFSDHTVGFEASIGAVCLGAKIIEKHITLDNKMRGPDHAASLNVKDLKNFVETLRIMENLINFKDRKITLEEIKTKKIAKKSLFTNKLLNKYEKIKISNLIPMRPYNNGIPVIKLDLILNKKIKKKLRKFHQIKIKDLK